MHRVLIYLFAVCMFWESAINATPMQAVQLTRGGDLLQATGTIHLNLPQGFFAPGSAAFIGDVPATGVPVETIGPYEVGTTSVVLERRTALSQPLQVAGTVHIAVQVTDLKIAGNQPITVTVASATQSWTVTAALSSSPGPYGTYGLTRTGSSQGTFVATIPAPITLLFKNGSITKRLDAGTATLVTTMGTWTTLAGSPTGPLAVAGLPLGVALTGTLVSPVLDLAIAPAQVNPTHPGPAFIDPTAVIDANVGSLGRGCSIGAGVTIGAGAVIGPNAVLADNVQVAINSIVGENASIGAGTALGIGAIIDASVVLNANCAVDAGATVRFGSNLGAACHVGSNATIGEQCVMRGNCIIGSGTRLEAGVHCGAAVTFSANLEIADGATVPSATAVSTSIVKCYLLNGSVEYRSLPVSSWPSLVAPPSAAVHQDSGSTSEGGNAQNSVSTPPADPNNPPAGSGQLPTDVGSDIARPKNGGTGQEYADGTYMCGWYAEQLRHKLEDLGYSTSFTTVYKKNPNKRWWKVFSPKWVDGHCLTDVHWSNGTTTWIEAQYVGADGVGQPKLDANGDGKVTHYDHESGDDTTDGDLRIEVYDNRAQAEAAGNSVPGN